MLRRSGLAVLGLALVALSASLAAGQSRVIPPGREALVMAMLGGPLPGGCALEGASIEPDHVTARYSCGELELRAPEAAERSLPRTAQFAVVFRGAWPEDAQRAVLERIRASEEDGFWSVTGEWSAPPEVDAPRPGLPNGLVVQLATLGAALLLALVGLLAIAGTPRPSIPRPASDPAARPLIAGGLLAALATAVIGAITFRFAYDDYANLLVARDHPLHPDQELRLLGIRAPFALAHALGDSHAAFVAIELTAWLAFVIVFARLLRRGGLSSGESILAASWAGASPYLIPLLRWGVGVQNLAVLAWIAAAMLAFDEASRAPSARRRVGAALLGLAAALAAVLTKYPVAVLVPVLSFVWCRTLAPRRSRVIASPLFHAGVALVMAIPVALRFAIGSRSSEPALHGERAWAYLANLGELAARAEPMLALALAAALAWSAHRLTRTPPAPASAPPVPAPAPVPVPVPLSHHAAPFLALAALSILPFLANRAYFTDYYPALSHAWLCALAAPFVARRLPRPRRIALPLALAITLLVLPWQSARPALHGGSPADRSQAWLEGAARALGDHRPARLVLRDACPDAPRSLETMLASAAGIDGLRWALAAPELEVAIGHDEPPTLSWCGHDDQWRLESPP